MILCFIVFSLSTTDTLSVELSNSFKGCDLHCEGYEDGTDDYTACSYLRSMWFVSFGIRTRQHVEARTALSRRSWTLFWNGKFFKWPARQAKYWMWDKSAHALLNINFMLGLCRQRHYESTDNSKSRYIPVYHFFFCSFDLQAFTNKIIITRKFTLIFMLSHEFMK